MNYHEGSVSAKTSNISIPNTQNDISRLEKLRRPSAAAMKKNLNILELLMIVIIKHYNISVSINSQKYAISNLFLQNH